MKKIIQLAAACCLAAICGTGTSVSAATPVQVSAETQKNLDVLQATQACPGCDLSGAELTRMKLAGANLEGANLAGARLLLADLARANLRNANLKGANLGGADLADADLSGANLSGAVLEGTFISQAQIQSATGYTPEAKLEIPDEELPVSDAADLPPDSDLRPTVDADTGAEAALSAQKKIEPAAASKPLPIAPAEVQVEQSRVAVGTEEQEIPAEIPVAQQAPATAARSGAVAGESAGTTAAKALPVAPGGDEQPEQMIAPAQPQSEAPAPAATLDLAAAPAPEAPEVAASVPPEPTAVQHAEEGVPAVVAEETVTVAPPTEAEAEPNQEAPALDSDREKLVKQLFKQKQCIDCDLSGLDFSGRDFKKFDLERVNFANSNLNKADLRKANLKGANLRGAMLQGADLRKADLYRADLRGADLSGARLDGALLDSASLDGSLAAPAE